MLPELKTTVRRVGQIGLLASTAFVAINGSQVEAGGGPHEGCVPEYLNPCGNPKLRINRIFKSSYFAAVYNGQSAGSSIDEDVIIIESYSTEGFLWFSRPTDKGINTAIADVSKHCSNITELGQVIHQQGFSSTIRSAISVSPANCTPAEP